MFTILVWKRCSMCGEQKPATAEFFGPRKHSPTFCRSQCRQCRKPNRPPVTPAERFWSKVNKNGPVPAHVPELGQCWQWIAAKSPYGYGHFLMNGKCHQSHRVAWQFSKGSIPDGKCVLHKCDNRKCVRVSGVDADSHLFLGTQLENIEDCVSKGRNGTPKLTADLMLEIRLAKGTQCEVAKRYGISQSHVCNVRNKKRWKHIA